MDSEQTTKVFEEAFVIRKDAYAIQNKEIYSKVELLLTKKDIIEHLDGKKTIGTYQFNKNKLKWICYDFDGTNLEEQFEKVKAFCQKLKKQNIECLLEFSGMKGYHIWIFTEEIDGASAKLWATELGIGSGAHEIFPKQESAGDGYGNLVKLPLGLHQVSKKQSHFYNDNFEPLNRAQSLELLEKIIQKRIVVPKVIIKERIRTIIKPQKKTNIPDDINYLISNGATIGNRHKSVYIITKELYNAGFPKEEILEQVLIFNKNCVETKGENIVRAHAEYLLKFPEKYLQKETITEINQEELKTILNDSLDKPTSDYYGIKDFNIKTEIFIQRNIGLGYTLSGNDLTVLAKAHYNIFEFQFGTGLNKKYFLLTHAHEPKNLGSNETYLRPLILKKDNEEMFLEIERLSENQPEKRILLHICKEQGIDTTEDIGKGIRAQKNSFKLLQSMAKKQEKSPFLFAETSGISQVEAEKLTPETWQKILNDFLLSGVEKDEVIILTFKSDLIKPNPQLIKPKQYQPYNPHELIFTNSKTTKSTSAMRTGKLIDSARTSNLLGFSTANEKIQGTLDGEVESINLDEIQEEKGSELHGQLNNILEIGTCEIRKGKAKVNIKSYAVLRWLGNPKFNAETRGKWFGDTKQALYQKFSDCLQIISSNNQAFGGRIAFIVFRDDLKTFKVIKQITLEEQGQCEAVVSTVMQSARDNFTNLFFDNEILEWLNKGFSQKYIDSLSEIEARAVLDSISEFVKGHKELAHRHARGKALKLASVDKAVELANNTLDKKELLELAGEYLQKIESENLLSFSNLVDISARENTINSFLKKAFKELPKHLKIILEAVHSFQKENELEKTISLDKLKLYFSESETIDENYKPHLILERATKNISRTNRQISELGAEIVSSEGNIPVIRILNPERLNQIMKPEPEPTKKGEAD